MAVRENQSTRKWAKSPGRKEGNVLALELGNHLTLKLRNALTLRANFVGTISGPRHVIKENIMREIFLEGVNFPLYLVK